MVIYFGPVRNLPSWYWVGRDIAEFLRSKHDIRFFDDIGDIPAESIVFWIKCPVTNDLASGVRAKRLQIAFFPVDAFLGSEHLAQCRDFIEACQLIVLHSRSMVEFFPAERVRFVDHYNKFGVAPERRRPGGELLWIGGFQYFPYVCRYVLEHDLHDLKINYLTDFNTPQAIRAANGLGAKLGLGIDFSSVASLSTFPVFEWSETLQQQLLLSCRAAFDCKDDQDFNQLHKPPTKLQKYVCSGIPCAINRSSPLRSSLGFELCDIMDTDTWFSSAYQKLSNDVGRALRTHLSIEAVAGSYLAFADEMRKGLRPAERRAEQLEAQFI